MNTPLLTFFLLFSASFLFAQNTVHVTARENGRGILKKRNGELFVIVPQHVVEGKEAGIKVVGQNSVSSQATHVSNYPADLAILRIDGGGEQPYKEWSVSKDIESVISNSFYGFLDYRDPDGSANLEEMVINNKSTEGLTITPRNPNFQLSKGMSGSALFVLSGNTKVYLGMLMSIDGKNGYVTRADLMMNIMSNFFNEKVATGTTDLPGTQPLSGALGRLVTKQVQLEVKRFEQNNNKAIFYFTLTNQNPSQQLIKYNSHISYHKLIDQNGETYEASDIQYGSKNNEVDLVYNVPAPCRVEFEVGANKISKASLLALNGYGYDFLFYHIPLGSEEVGQTQEKHQTSTQKNLGKTIDKQVLLTVTGFEQNNNKVIFRFTLENQNPVKQVVKYHSHISYHQLIDQNGLSYNATHIKYGSAANEVDLVHKVPVKCEVEFEVGANKISKAAYLQLNGYGYEFSFTHIDLLASSSGYSPSTIPSAPTSKGNNRNYLASMTEKGVKLGIQKVEQIGNKALVYFTLENQDPIKKSLDVSTHVSYAKLESDGYSFDCSSIELSNTGTQCRLIYGAQATCYAEFEVGAVQISKIKRIKLGLYGYDFDFIASNGALKSAKTVEANQKLFEEGANAIFKLLKN